MTFENQTIKVGDMVDCVWIDPDGEPALTGVVLGFSNMWKRQKVHVYWNKVGIRLEWISDLKVIK